MNAVVYVLAVLLPLSAAAQTQVDRAARQLDSLSGFTLDEWKMSPDLHLLRGMAADPAGAGFDDSRWEVLKLHQRVYPDSCWLRKEIVLPERILGQPVQGTVRFLVSVDDYGYLWVNGEPRGYFPWDGEFVLTTDARPGQRFLLAIKAINTGGPLELLRAEIGADRTAGLRQSIQDLALSLRTGQKLLSFDTYQTNANRKVDPGVDNSRADRGEKRRLGELLQTLAGRLDLAALGSGALDRFSASMDAVKTGLQPVGQFAKRFTLYFDANAHIDAAWLWRSMETVQVCRNTFSSVFNMMAQRPGFTYTQSSAAYYRWMQTMYPGIFRSIRQRVQDGRWESVGGMWVEPDCNLPSGESWAHQLLLGKQYFRDSVGTDVTIGWNPDSFGYNLNMPMFYANAGIDAFITQKIGWNETNVFPYRLFWWQSPDGSRILSYFPFDYVSTINDPMQYVDWMRQFDANTGFTKMLVLFGVGDHGGGPSLEMLDRIDRLKKLDVYPTIEYGTAGTYLSWLKAQDLGGVPVWKDELYLEYHQGTYTTQAAMKKFNRTEEVLLTNAEKFSTLAAVTAGRPYHGAALAEAWKNLMFTQFHDILPGSSIREVYLDATETHHDVQSAAHRELREAFASIVGRINTSRFVHGIPLTVFNPLSWERKDIATVPLAEDDTASYRVLDGLGGELPSQTVNNAGGQRAIIFLAGPVPSMGYATYELRKTAAARAPDTSLSSPWTVGNEAFTVTIDETTGWIGSIVDRRHNRELLKGFGNQLQLLEDTPRDYDAWNIGWTGRTFSSSFRRAEVVERGPVRTVVRLFRDYLKPGTKKSFPTEDFPTSFFEQDIILYRGLDRIEFVTRADWWEDHTMLKVAFPLAISDTVATYEIPFGSIQRSTQMRTSWEKAKVEVPAQRWADVSSGGYGVSLVNSAKYGYDIKGNVMRLSLLRSPTSPDPTADRGKHTMAYALYPHAGRWDEASTVQRGYEFNAPLIPVMTTAHRGALPPSHSFAGISPSNFVLTTVKKAEKDNGWIFQWYDALGRGDEAVLTLPAPPRKAVLSDFLEGSGIPVPVSGTTLRVPGKKNGVTTVKVFF